jgi:hypothetical protein
MDQNGVIERIFLLFKPMFAFDLSAMLRPKNWEIISPIIYIYWGGDKLGFALVLIVCWRLEKGEVV